MLDPLFQEKTSSLFAYVDALRDDSVSLANVMLLTRNFAHFTPRMQGRIADESNLLALVALLHSSDACASRVAADVLMHALYFEKPKATKQTRGVTAKMSPVMDVKASMDELRRVLLPGWRRMFRASATGADDDTSDDDALQLLESELDDVCAQLSAPSREELLRVVLDLHLCEEPLTTLEACTDEQEPLGNENVRLTHTDAIEDVARQSSVETHSRFLQYVLPASFRNTPEPDDTSFLGSAHLWRFVRKLYIMTIRGNARPWQPSLDGIKSVLSRWTTLSDVVFSDATHERRSRFLQFAVSVMATAPTELRSPSVAIDDVVAVADQFLANAHTSGVAYELLFTLCEQSERHVDWILEHFTARHDDGSDDLEPLDATQDDRTRVPQAFSNLLRGLRLEYLSVRVSASRVKGQETDSVRTLLDPRAPSTPALAYAVVLVQTLASRSLAILPWFVDRCGVELLFDILLLEPKYASSLRPSLHTKLLSSLLVLLTRVLELHPDTVHFAIADARIVHRVARCAFAHKSSTQVAALELLHRMSASTTVRDMLCRLEHRHSSVSRVDHDMVRCLEERCVKLQITPPLRPRDVVELAHLLHVPYFLDLSTAELVRLSLCFVESRLVDDGAFMVVINNGQFGVAPAWMLSETSVPTGAAADGASAMAPVRDSPSAKRIADAFRRVVSKKTADGTLMMYKIERDGYWRCTTLPVRRTIAKAITHSVMGDASPSSPWHKHTSLGLVSRACRFLIEDRAELVRRVAFTTRRSEASVLRAVRAHPLSRVVSLLARSPFFVGVSRDKLACLAYRIGAPELVSSSDIESETLASLVLVLHDGVECTVRTQPADQIGTTVSQSLPPGSLVGFPTWLVGDVSVRALSSVVLRLKPTLVLGVRITLDDLLTELGDADTNARITRWREAVHGGGLIKLLDTMTVLPTATLCRELESDRLQCAAAALLEQLVQSRAVATSLLLTDTWALQVVFDVAISALAAPVVRQALDALGSLTRDSALCELFCAADLHGRERLQAPSTTTRLTAFIALVASFPLRQWAAQADVLERFFRIQRHGFTHVSAAREHVSEVWTPEYIQHCQFVLQHDRDGSLGTAEAVAAHLTHTAQYETSRLRLLTHCRETALHVDIFHSLLHSRRGAPCASRMALVVLFCEDAALRERVWTLSAISIRSFDEVLLTVAADLELLLHAPRTSIDQQQEDGAREKLGVYCAFVSLICSSDTDEERDVGLRVRIETECSILSTLIQLLGRFEARRHVRCVCG